jgi:hypothetical protein
MVSASFFEQRIAAAMLRPTFEVPATAHLVIGCAHVRNTHRNRTGATHVCVTGGACFTSSGAPLFLQPTVTPPLEMA